MTGIVDGAQAPTAAPAPNAAQPQAAQAVPQVTVADMPPEALSARLEQAKRSERAALLAELGVSDPAEAKAAIAAKRAAEESAKSDADKLAALNLTVAAQTRALTVAVNQAASQLKPEHKAVLDGIAGTDQARWLELYGQLAPTWSAQTVQPQAAVVATTQPVVAIKTPSAVVPATTSPTGGAPPPNGAQSPPNHAAVFAELNKVNPFAAQRYADKHGDACFKQ